MAEYGYATKADVAAARAQPLGLHPRVDDDHMRAPYFVAQVEQFVLVAPAVRRDGRRSPPPAVHRRARDPHHARPGPPAAGASRRSTTCSSTPRTTRRARSCRSSRRPAHVVAYVGGRDYYGSGAVRAVRPRGPGSAPGRLRVQAVRARGRARGPHPACRARIRRPTTLTINTPGQAPWVVHNYDGDGGGR